MGGNGLQIAHISAAVAAQIEHEVAPPARFHQGQAGGELLRAVPVEGIEADIRRIRVKPCERAPLRRHVGENGLPVAAERVGAFAVPIQAVRRAVFRRVHRVGVGFGGRFPRGKSRIQDKFARLRIDKGDEFARAARLHRAADLRPAEQIHSLFDARKAGGGIFHDGIEAHAVRLRQERDADALVAPLALGNELRVFVRGIKIGEAVGHDDPVQRVVERVEIDVLVILLIERTDHPFEFSQARVPRIGASQPPREKGGGDDENGEKNNKRPPAPSLGRGGRLALLTILFHAKNSYDCNNL